MKVPVKIHRFWQTIAIFVGIFLIISGVQTHNTETSTQVQLDFAHLIIIIGLGTILVDGWFLSRT